MKRFLPNVHGIHQKNANKYLNVAPTVQSPECQGQDFKEKEFCICGNLGGRSPDGDHAHRYNPTLRIMMNKPNYRSQQGKENSTAANLPVVKQKMLIVFDFDWTIVDGNTDVHVKELVSTENMSLELRTNPPHDWTEHMQKVMASLHKNGITEDDIQRNMMELELAPGMANLLHWIRTNESLEAIIISDSNSLFIDIVLEKYNLHDIFLHIFTNPAKFNDIGCLCIQPFHKNDWCDISAKNLCKGRVLEDFLAAQKQLGRIYTAVCYIGDGTNDICPCRRLTDKDCALIRIGFAFWKQLETNKLSKDKNHRKLGIQAKICPYTSGDQVKEFVEQVQEIYFGDE